MKSERRLALLSVYNKTGIVEFAEQLITLGFDILASGGTAGELTKAGVPVRDTADFIADGQTALFLQTCRNLSIPMYDRALVHRELRQFAGAFLEHRVVTLTQEIHAGLMAIDNDDHNAQLRQRGIGRIELLRCDLYPLAQEIARVGSTLESVIHLTDVGGPTLLRSAAKGRRFVIPDVEDGQLVLDFLSSGSQDRAELDAYLVSKAEAVVSQYTAISSAYHERYVGKYQARLLDFRRSLLSDARPEATNV